MLPFTMKCPDPRVSDPLGASVEHEEEAEEAAP